MGKHNNGYKKAAMMRGLCHSPSATAVCSSNGVRSVIVPRPGPANAKYSRLVEPSSNRPPCSVLLSSTIARTRPPLPPQAPSTLPKGPKPVGIQPHQLQLVPLTPSTVFQVVVLRVSLHCQGCAGKLKKHLSKMEGVTSFSIDLETKRVTVMGHITPNGVLESISKVKRAELWTSC